MTQSVSKAVRTYLQVKSFPLCSYHSDILCGSPKQEACRWGWHIFCEWDFVDDCAKKSGKFFWYQHVTPLKNNGPCFLPSTLGKYKNSPQRGLCSSLCASGVVYLEFISVLFWDKVYMWMSKAEDSQWPKTEPAKVDDRKIQLFVCLFVFWYFKH